MADPRTYNLTIYLIKSDNDESVDAIDSKTIDKKVSISINEEVEALLHVKKTTDNKPDWTEFLSQAEEVPSALFDSNRRIGAALSINVKGSQFVVTFGSGYTMVNPNAIERDFGLRVALNSTDSVELRSIDKSTNSLAPLNSRAQSSLGVEIDSFLIDTESDLLFALTGKSKIKKLGSMVTGRDSLTIKPQLDFKQLPEILATVLRLYRKKLPADYQWVDNVRKIKDKQLSDKLFDELVRLLNSDKTTHVWLGEPEIIDWSTVDGFQVGSSRITHQTLSLAKVLKEIRHSKPNLTAKILDSTFIYCKAADGSPLKKWTVARCIFAEIVFESKTYVLRDGIWYKVDDDFIAVINRSVNKIKAYSVQFPEYAHACENTYNKDVATRIPSTICLDVNTISYGGGRSKIEPCDLLIEQRDFVHVKRYAGSQTLSHLFNQGTVAAETFKRSQEFREKLNQKLPQNAQLPISDRDINSRQYSVVYAICTDKKSLPADLPFFSKVALKKAMESLRTMGFNVYMAQIHFDANFAVTSKTKPQKNKKTKTAA